MLRGARNHALIVDAIYHLVRSGNPSPSPEEIAARAGVGTRTIFRQFQDLEQLAASLMERVLAESAALFGSDAPTGDWGRDLSREIRRRARVFEHLAPFRRSGDLFRHRVALLQRQNARFAELLRSSVEAILPPLSGRAGDIVEALDALLSFEVWLRLRDQQKLGRKKAIAVLEHAAGALVRAALTSGG